jgi:hypothetical protein
MLIILIVLVILFGGFGYNRYGWSGGGIGLGGVLLIALALYYFGFFRHF